MYQDVQIGIPMQVMWIALVTPGGTVASDLRAVSYIGIPLAYVGAKAAGMDFGGMIIQSVKLVGEQHQLFLNNLSFLYPIEPSPSVDSL